MQIRKVHLTKSNVNYVTAIYADYAQKITGKDGIREKLFVKLFCISGDAYKKATSIVSDIVNNPDDNELYEVYVGGAHNERDEAVAYARVVGKSNIAEVIYLTDDYFYANMAFNMILGKVEETCNEDIYLEVPKIDNMAATIAHDKGFVMQNAIDNNMILLKKVVRENEWDNTNRQR